MRNIFDLFYPNIKFAFLKILEGFKVTFCWVEGRSCIPDIRKDCFLQYHAQGPLWLT
jgi:hypothetical protein